MTAPSSDVEAARLLVGVLERQGVRRVVLSPGSRNAPLLVTAARSATIERHVVVDERSAAFFALGLARQSGETVALACTSGTALLDYAPAVAEAYYQGVSLLVISADRPPEWIDQDDGQAIRQRGALAAVVKGSFELPVGTGDAERWHANRLVNEAINLSREGMPGPVHVNVPLREPLYGFSPRPATAERVVAPAATYVALAHGESARLRERLFGSPAVMIVAGFMPPDEELAAAIVRLTRMDNVVVLADTMANLPAPSVINTVDRVLATISPAERPALAPDLLITIGGAPLSRRLKEFIREFPPAEHWHAGQRHAPPDTYRSLSLYANVSPVTFFRQLGADTRATGDGYAARWRERRTVAAARHEAAVAALPWCDLKAFSLLLPALPAGCLLHLGNSTPARYAQLFGASRAARTDGNRGTSGIEGATSTAAGAAVASGRLTVLVTGDLSFLYDSNALWGLPLPPGLKIVVMKNGGGGIFRCLPGPPGLPEAGELFETPHGVNIAALARVHGLETREAGDEGELRAALPGFLAPAARPAVLVIDTAGRPNGELLKRYFEYLKM
ncbi:MAG: 2-succinyl-5-enolpyruvyl-6-hydroxy-3-cyclohexene-1-carboxylic-acid synthase [Odoribacteraceae bacterium]|jgi:2-succinyl-5-enolpyruvyl-6-hydroxy-3-cyclohexene-1-carboxylate synthase|nr:2-succinyl-5-enolpyruvyl-6-hydroxy-3-cyclohexene-1-carboxylic-acid synthase [Odoribacteraceae bacterium]